jgi:hypothetical protein
MLYGLTMLDLPFFLNPSRTVDYSIDAIFDGARIRKVWVDWMYPTTPSSSNECC